MKDRDISELSVIDPGQIRIYNETKAEVERMGSEIEEMIHDYLELQEVDFEYGKPPPDENEIGKFRKSDPDTSHKAALDIYPRSGQHRHKALMAVAGSGSRGMTYEEVELATGINGVWKRLSELKAGGWIESDGERIIQGTQSMGFIYRITDRARKHIETKERAGVIEID